MSERQKGIGVAWGLTSTVYTNAGTAMVVKGVSQSLEKDAEESEHRDPASGSVIGTTLFNPTKTITLKVFPSASTIANAKTSAAVTPAIGDAFAVTDPGDAEMAGTYMVKKVSKAKEVAKRVEFDITIIQHDSDITADIT